MHTWSAGYDHTRGEYALYLYVAPWWAVLVSILATACDALTGDRLCHTRFFGDLVWRGVYFANEHARLEYRVVVSEEAALALGCDSSEHAEDED